MMQASDFRIGNYYKGIYVNENKIPISAFIGYFINDGPGMTTRLLTGLKWYLHHPSYGVFINDLIDEKKFLRLRGMGDKTWEELLSLYSYFINSSETKVFKVVTANDLLCWAEGNYYGEYIPLTPEIMEKVGFFSYYNTGICHHIKYGGDIGFREPDEQLEVEGYTLNHGSLSHKKSLLYLHQLQNLFFALTGEELKLEATEEIIKNKKV